MATHFLLLAQKKVSKEKCTRISRCSSLDCHFIYGNFRTRYAQTDENFLQIQLHKGGKEGNIIFPRIKCGEVFRYFSIRKTFKNTAFV